jgi:hypothetical protein
VEDVCNVYPLSATTPTLSSVNLTSAGSSILPRLKEVEYVLLVCQASSLIRHKDTVLRSTVSAMIYRQVTAGPVQEVQL